MSNIEVKNLAHTNIMQFALELQSLIQAGWVFNEKNARTLTIHGGVLRATLVRNVNQATEVKEAEVLSVNESEVIAQSPVGKTTVKRSTKAEK